MSDGQWEDADLYQRIAEEFRKKIIDGVYRPGDGLPPIRALKQQRNCTLDTIQHAYRELAEQGLITSRAGKGTHVICPIDTEKFQVPTPLRKVKLVHRAESFLLEAIIAGYSFEEIEESIGLARRHMQSF